MTFRLIVSDMNAAQLIPWIQDGGIRVWHSIDLGNLEQQWITPAEAEEKPHWRACSLEDTDVITDPNEIAVVVLEEVERFGVNLRVSGNGLSLKLTDDSNDYLNERLEAEERTKWASYRFDYDTQEALILDTTSEPGSLQDLIEVGEALGLP